MKKNETKLYKKETNGKQDHKEDIATECQETGNECDVDVCTTLN